MGSPARPRSLNLCGFRNGSTRRPKVLAPARQQSVDNLARAPRAAKRPAGKARRRANSRSAIGPRSNAERSDPAGMQRCSNAVGGLSTGCYGPGLALLPVITLHASLSGTPRLQRTTWPGGAGGRSAKSPRMARTCPLRASRISAMVASVSPSRVKRASPGPARMRLASASHPGSIGQEEDEDPGPLLRVRRLRPSRTKSRRAPAERRPAQSACSRHAPPGAGSGPPPAAPGPSTAPPTGSARPKQAATAPSGDSPRRATWLVPRSCIDAPSRSDSR